MLAADLAPGFENLFEPAFYFGRLCSGRVGRCIDRRSVLFGVRCRQADQTAVRAVRLVVSVDRLLERCERQKQSFAPCRLFDACEPI